MQAPSVPWCCPASVLRSGCTASGQIMTCAISTIVAGPPAGSAVYIFQVQVQAATAGVYTVNSTVASAPREQVTSNNGPAQNSVTVISTCGQYTLGNPFPCPGPTFVFTNSTASSSNPDQATCCVSVHPHRHLQPVVCYHMAKLVC